eukprot:TRINITY_DN1543_c0_g1_i7.p1 TRINITY_DN1543_c0_g1~~TRINITY_DN1543_c0_g1_i7.p1  ORF type:complete len:580 (+),score=78.22 TRINITY_DN1543_c0_g1_i7:94-1740(+)
MAGGSFAGGSFGTGGRMVMAEEDAGVCAGVCFEQVGEQAEGWAYKGPRRGQWEQVTTMQYVGEGRGSIDLEPVGNRSWRIRLCVLFVIALLVISAVAVALYFLLLYNSKHTQIRVKIPETGYDCFKDYWRFEDEWSPRRKAYCCHHYHRACPEHHTVVHTRVIPSPTLPPRIVVRDHVVRVPDREVEMKTKYVSLPSPTLPPKIVTKYKYKYMNPEKPDCEDGYYHWKDMWSDTKKEWCCEHENKACYDCEAGRDEWRHRWSHHKKVWCCKLTGDYCDYEVESDLKSCKLWGDPHVVTFDKSHLVFYSEGDFWIVKSPMTKIQGRFQATKWTRENDKTDYSSMTSILIAGRIMGGHKLEVQSMEGKILCNGQEILAGFGTQTCGGATVSYDSRGQLVDSAMSFLPHKVVHITLHDGYWIQVNRWPNFINALVTMRAEGQDGICGNFNGFAGDDSGEELHKRWGHGVASYEDLFSYHLPLHIPKAKPSPTRCGKAKIDRAAHVCTHRIRDASPAWSFAECMGDFCDNARGDGEVSYEAEEMREHYIHAQ